MPGGVILIPLLFAACFGGLAYLLLQALRESTESYAAVYAVETAREFEEIFLFISPARLADIARVSAATGFILFFLLFGSFESYGGIVAGLVAGLVAAALALNAPRFILKYLRAQRLKRFNNQLVDALMTMSNALKAGFSILQAFEAVVKEKRNPISQEFGVFLQQLRVGVRFEDALNELEKRVGSEDLQIMVLSIETARLTGGNLTEVFEKLAYVIRERLRIQDRIRSLTAQGRLQGLVVGAMPLLLLFAMTMLDPKMMMPFLTSMQGISILSFVVVLEILGAVIIRKIVNINI